jgi:phasin family protein
MYPTSDPFVQLGKSNIEAALSVANITLQSTERLMDIQLRTAKDALDQGLRSAKALTDVKNIQDLVALQSVAAQPNLEKALDYSRSLYAVASDAQVRINKVVEARISEISGEVKTAMDKVANSTPAGSEAAFAAFKSAFTAANNAYQSMTRAAREASDDVATTAAAPAKAAAKQAKKKTR